MPLKLPSVCGFVSPGMLDWAVFRNSRMRHQELLSGKGPAAQQIKHLSC